MSIDAELVSRMAHGHYGIAVEARRADQLAAEVERLTSTVTTAARRLEFDILPGHHAVHLRRGRSGTDCP